VFLVVDLIFGFFWGGMAEAAKITSFLTECHLAWRTWMLQVGELVRPVTVRLSQNELIDLVTKACPLEDGPSSIFSNDVTTKLFTEVIFALALYLFFSFVVRLAWR
jgi:hypothetical protein